MSKTLSLTNCLLFLILLLALGVRTWGIQFGLPYLYHLDEPFYVMHALKFGTGDLNPHWFLYPTLYMYLLFFLYSVYFIVGVFIGLFNSPYDFAIQYFSNPTWFYLIGRFTTALLGTLTVVYVYKIGKRLYEKDVGLLGAFFLAFSFLHVQHSHYITCDVPMVLLLTISFYYCVRVLLDGDTKYYILAGLFAGLGGATKYTGIIIGLSLPCAHFLRVADGKKGWIEGIFNKKLGLGCLFILIGFLIGCPYSILDFQTFWSFIVGHYQQAKAGWLGSGGEEAWLKVFSYYLRNGLGFSLEILSLAGVAYCLILRKKEGLLLVFFPIIYYLFMAGSSLNFERYWILILPIMVLLGAKLIVDIVSRIPFHLKSYAIAVLALLVIINPAIGVIRYDHLISQKDTRTIAKEWVEANIPAGKKIVLEKGGPQLFLNKESLYAEFLRETGQIKDDRLEKSDSYKTTPEEPSTNKAQYYQLLLSLPEPHVSYYLYCTWSAGEKSVDKWMDEGFSYIVIGEQYRGYLSAPKKYPQIVSFYQELEEKEVLVKKFESEGDRLGPQIKIYKIRKNLRSK